MPYCTLWTPPPHALTKPRAVEHLAIDTVSPCVEYVPHTTYSPDDHIKYVYEIIWFELAAYLSLLYAIHLDHCTTRGRFEYVEACVEELSRDVHVLLTSL